MQTLIEALKYITTGTLPPVSDAGKSFVHDPKLESATSTKAQIRLSFRIDGDQQAVLAVRSFQLTQTKASRQFKALEGVLKIKSLETGAERSVSHKCVDMDALVPQLMGVSAAVLENVIFCHQSESDWPLSDSKSLKLKFDDIFSATRYTKALEVLTKMRNEKKTAIKLMEAELRLVDAQQQQAKKLQDERSSTETTITANRDKKQRIDDESGRLEQELAQHAGKVAELSALRSKAKDKEMLIALMTQEKARAYDKMRTEIDDSDQQLQKHHADNMQAVTSLTARIKAQEERARQLQLGVEENDREYQDNVKAIGKYEQQEAELQQRRVELTSTRDRLTSQHHVEVKQGEDEDGKEAAFLDTLQRVLERQKADLRSHKDAIGKVDAGFEESVQGLKTKEVKLSEQLHFRRQNAGKTVARIKELVQRTKEIDASVDKDEHAARSEELLELERKLNADDVDAAGEPGEGQDDARVLMAEKQRVLNSVQAELLVLHDERKKFTHQSDALSVIKHRQSQLLAQLTRHNSQLNSLLASHDLADLCLPHILPFPTAPLSTSSSSSPTSLLHKQYDSSTLLPFLTSEHRHLKVDLRTRTDTHTDTANALSRLHGQLKLLKEELAAIDPQVDRIRKVFSSPSPSFPSSSASPSSSEAEPPPPIHLAEYRDATQYDEEVQGLQLKLDKLVAEKARNVNTLELLEKYHAKYKEDAHCPMCLRGFEGEGGERFEARMAELIATVRELLMGDKAEKKAAVVRRRMRRMAELSPLFHDYVRLNVKERGSIQAKVDAVQREVDEAEVKAEEEERAVKRLAAREQRLVELLTQATEVRRLYVEVVDAVKAVEKEKEKVKASAGVGKDGAGGRELEQVVRELEEKEKLRSRVQGEVSALQERMNAAMKRREDITRRFHSLKTQLADVDKLLEERSSNDREVLKLKQTWQEDKDEADKLTATQAQLRETLQKQEKEREEQRKKNAEGEAVLQHSVSELQREVDAFSKQVDGIASIVAEMNSGRGLHSQRELYAKANALKKMREERDNGLKELAQLKEKVAEAHSELLDIEANLDYRKRQYDIEQHSKEMQELQQQLHSSSLDAAALAALQAKEQRLERLHAKSSELKGALVQLQKYADERAKDLSSPLYRDVASRYASALIELQTNVMACSDLDVYSRCLDVALMHYHTLKMREINDILRDYWRAIYRGTDIDEIYIKSQVETETGKRRAYSYSVMMKQGDIDLEMRGRCSAGQRVLASLLIRLALADCFCLTAGFLALDEPTTNLDHANIRAFAAALADIVERRRQQANFQLLVITHDEKFVEEMGRRAGVEDYYRITKDPTTHYSKIQRKKWTQEREE